MHQVELRDRCELVTLPPPMNGGGEGKIYVKTETISIKLYDKPLEDLRERRCTAWIENPLHDVPTLDGSVRATVPLDIVQDPVTKAFLGFAMWRVKDPVSTALLCNPASSRFQSFEKRLVLAMRVLAAIAYVENHILCPIFSDFKDNNILFRDNGMPTLIDIDSLQVRLKDGTVLRSPAATPEWLPPELQGVDLGKVNRTKQHHNFAINSFIWMFLMNGTHPFDAVGHPEGRLARRIAAGDFPHGPSARYSPSPLAPEFDWLPPEFRALFLRAFVDGHLDPFARPSASEWAEAIGREIESPYALSVPGRVKSARLAVRAAAQTFSAFELPAFSKRWAMIAAVLAANVASAFLILPSLFHSGEPREFAPVAEIRTTNGNPSENTGVGTRPSPIRRSLPSASRAVRTEPLQDAPQSRYEEPALVRELREKIRAESLGSR